MPEPKILKRLVKQLQAKGMGESQAHAIAVKSLQKSGNLKKGSTQPTAKGIKRGNMTPAQRAKDRYMKEHHEVKASELVYNPKTNTVRKKK